MDKKIKVLFFSFLTVFFGFFNASSAKADAWGTNFGAEGMGQMMDEIQKMIHGAIMGALKTAAVQTIDNTVNNLISGGTTSGSMFINDWDDFLYQSPRRKSDVFMNDFFAITTRGRASGLNYRSNCGRGFARSDYSGYLTNRAQKYTVATKLPTIDLQDYVCDPADMFKNETWRAFDAFTGKTINNPIGYILTAQEVQQADIARRKKEAEVKAMAYQGYKAQTKGGIVVTPGSTIKDVVSNVKDIPNKSLATAKDAPEVITSIVTSILTKTIQQGIGSAQSNIYRETGNRDRNYSRGMSSVLEGQSPEENFNQTDISKNSPAHLFYDIKK